MKLLIIDDEKNMCHMLKAMVEAYGYRAETAGDGKEGLERVRSETYDFILCDVKMPEMGGLLFLEKASAFLVDSTVIMMSAYGTVDTALEAMKAGAYDFISKPFKKDEVLLALKKAEERETLRKENRRLKMEIEAISKTGSFDEMIGTSSSMQDIFALSRKVAKYDATVLITGESGTGKELIARGIHNNSERKEHAFVAVNCGSIPANLLESELFGHQKGAFTGAERNKKGLLEEAEGGTVFLDEIGELPLDMQVKLLRVLQEREIRSVGATKHKQINIRVLAATARDLSEMVKTGSFREDLFYRLNVIQMHLPPLRDRSEDIPILTKHFINKINVLYELQLGGISQTALKLLHGYYWPGNVRELENVLQHCAVMAEEEVIRSYHLPDKIRKEKTKKRNEVCEGGWEEGISLKQAQKSLERQFITQALNATRGNKSKAASLLEISYPSILNKIKEYGI